MPTITYSAFLTKQGAVRKNWKRRWMVLDSHDKLTYYKTQQSSTPAGVIALSEVKDVVAASECGNVWPEHIDKKCAFGLVTTTRTWLLYSDDIKEFENWMHYIQKGSRIAHAIPTGAPVTSGLTSSVESQNHLGRTKSVVVLKKTPAGSSTSNSAAGTNVEDSNRSTPDAELPEQSSGDDAAPGADVATHSVDAAGTEAAVDEDGYSSSDSNDGSDRAGE
eukprot:TRINITY_DN12006_c3_g1_i4.p3 TRINITY_DN12006_c3_g1~~TRINITY_DN12006_c3_g1_i4.p3  ORF type:complete len:220 (+),score=34.90 TRINITY_DN12006_c3_g1_i4:106-765(+)